jgi:hypothetical protein
MHILGWTDHILVQSELPLPCLSLFLQPSHERVLLTVILIWPFLAKPPRKSSDCLDRKVPLSQKSTINSCRSPYVLPLCSTQIQTTSDFRDTTHPFNYSYSDSYKTKSMTNQKPKKKLKFQPETQCCAADRYQTHTAGDRGTMRGVGQRRPCTTVQACRYAIRA